MTKTAWAKCWALRTSIIAIFWGLSLPALATDWTYTVRKGDTLWGLCNTYTHVVDCWLKVGPYNKVEYPRNLAPGTRIRFPAAWLKEPPAPAIVSFIRGANLLKTLPDKQSSALLLGDRLPIGSSLIVGEQSLAVLVFADGSTMTVEAGTELRLDTLSSFGKAGMVDTRVYLKRGSVHSRVPKMQPNNRFEVMTPSSVAAVRGTDFRVTSVVREPAQTRNEVFDGRVEVANETDERQLPMATGLLATEGKALPDVVPLLASPVFAANDLGNRSLYHKLSWQDVKGAESYKLEISAREEPGNILEQRLVETNLADLSGLPEGCYLARVSAIDRDDFQGMPGETRLCLVPLLPGVSGLKADMPEHDKVHLQWNKLDGAVSYQVEFAANEAFTNILQSTSVNSSTAEVNFAVHTKIYLRVLAVDEHGVAGEAGDVVLLEPSPMKEKGFWEVLLSVALFALVVL